MPAENFFLVRFPANNVQFDRKFKFRTKNSENTMTTANIIMSALVKIRKEQVETDKEEFVDGLVSVAVPILDRRNHFFANLSIHAANTRISMMEITNHIPHMQKTSQDLTLIIDPRDN
jgi:IclR family acetate operon transcriptional repressor